MIQALRLQIVGLVFLAAGCQAAKADVIYSSFASGTTYVVGTGTTVSGPSGSFGPFSPGTIELAGAFTPGVNTTLEQIDVAIDFFTEPAQDSNLFNLSLNADAGGLPGAVIEAWTGLQAPTVGYGTYSLVNTVLPYSNIGLLAGQRYWLVASAGAPSTLVAWISNTTPGTIATNTGAAWLLGTPETFLFDVQGVPEPGTSLPVGVGLAVATAFGLARRFAFRRAS